MDHLSLDNYTFDSRFLHSLLESAARIFARNARSLYIKGRHQRSEQYDDDADDDERKERKTKGTRVLLIIT